MRSKNVYTAIGHLGNKKPELKFTTNGTPYARFSVACNYSYKRDGQAVQCCDWIPFIAYGKLAEIVSKHLDAGSHVSVDGKLKPWKSTSGETTRYGLDVVVTDILFLDPKQATVPEEIAQASPACEVAPPDSDSPF